MGLSELIKQAEELLGKCSDGPWLICVYGDSYSIGSKDKYNILVDRNENIKANPDSDFIIFARNHMQELVDIIKEYRQIIESLKIGDKCWCQVAIGNPMMTDHSKTCKKAQEIEYKYA